MAGRTRGPPAIETQNVAVWWYRPDSYGELVVLIDVGIVAQVWGLLKFGVRGVRGRLDAKKKANHGGTETRRASEFARALLGTCGLRTAPGVLARLRASQTAPDRILTRFEKEDF